MARDIFNRITDNFGGSFSADSATLIFPAMSVSGGAAVGLLIQNLQLTYSQNVSRLYEVGSPRIYYVGGRTEGRGTIQRIIGPRQVTTQFLRKFGDVCAANNNMEITLDTDCSSELNPFNQDAYLSPVAGTDGGISYVCYFVVITSVGFAIAAQDMVINSDTQFMFSNFTEK